MADKQPARGRAPMDWNDIQRWMGARQVEVQDALGRVNRDPRVRAVAGYVGSGTGRLVGAIEEVAETARDFAGIHKFGLQVVDPRKYRQGLAASPLGPLIRMDQQMIREIGEVRSDPRQWPLKGQEVINAVIPKRVATAKGNAPATASDAFGRQFSETQSQGRLGAQVASIALPAARVASPARQVAKLTGIEKYLAQGFNLEEAYYLDELYDGWGHHSLRRKWANKLGIPKVIVDSPLFVVKPKGITRGEFYELHAKVDPKFKGTKLADDMARWSAAKLGIKPYGLLGQTWHGTTPLMKAAVGSGAAGGFAAAELAQSDRER